MANDKTPAPAAPPVVPLAKGKDGFPLSSCRVCGSTNRDPCRETSRQLIDGKVYVWLRTRCADCGQHRFDRIVRDARKPKAKD